MWKGVRLGFSLLFTVTLPLSPLCRALWGGPVGAASAGNLALRSLVVLAGGTSVREQMEGGLGHLCTCALRWIPGRSPVVMEAPATFLSGALPHSFSIAHFRNVSFSWPLRSGDSQGPFVLYLGTLRYLVASFHPAYTFIPSPFMKHSMNSLSLA